MWIHTINGRDELVIHPEHIKRLLDEGGVEVPDPRIKPEVVQESAGPEQAVESELAPESEQIDDSTINNAGSDSADPVDDRGSTVTDATVPGSGHPGPSRRKSR